MPYFYDMLKLNAKGLLAPGDPIQCKLSDMKTYFVDAFLSETRKANFDRYIKYSTDLKSLLGGVKIMQWINGSFVTRKTNPKDIDIISFVSHVSVRALGSKLLPFRPPGSWDNYGVDAYILEVHLSNSKHYSFTELDIKYWRNQFGHTRPNRKGVKPKIRGYPLTQ